MTKKDYILIAQSIKDLMDTSVVNNQKINIGHVQNFTDILAVKFKKDNPKFSIDKWEKYIYGNGVGNYQSIYANIKEIK